MLLALAARIQLTAFVFRFFCWRNAGVLGVFWLSWLASAGWAAAATVDGLRCEYRAEPMGLDVAQPRLSWVVTSDRRAETQTACQILVASSSEKLALNEGDLWNSGRMAESNSLNMAYTGRPLVSQQACFWKVRVWDRDGQPSAWSAPARWTMGLLHADDWQAQWISDPVLADPANRPLTPIHCYRSELTTNPAAAKWIELDLGTSRRVDAVDLLAARPRQQSNQFRSVMFPRRFRITVANAPDFHDARVVVDQTEADYFDPRVQRSHFPIAAVDARYVRLEVTRLGRWDGGEYGLALGGFQVFDGTNALAVNVPVSCSDSMEDARWSKRFLVDGQAKVAIAPDSSALAVAIPGVPAEHAVSRVPLLRREFVLPGGVKRALLFVTARGFYEVHLNGRRVGDELLAPGYTAYAERLQYQTHDVTALLHRGTNAVGALLGYGWYAGHLNLYPSRNTDGAFPQFLAQLEVTLADGKTFTVVTDGNWRSTLSGPVRYADLLDGEAYDCRRELPGWDQPGFDDQGWTPVWTLARDDTPLVWPRCQPVKKIQEMRPVARREVRPGVYVFDFGQEITGWCRLHVNGPVGTQITLRHAEEIGADGNVNLKNLWGVAQQDDYLLDGRGPRTLEPHFTYHGFRYVEVTGLPSPPPTNALVGINIHSALPEAGDWECSNPLYNRIFNTARWTQRNLLFDVPAGCAARGERVAWLGDIRPCVPTVCFNFDAAGFFAKYSADIRDGQAPDGRFADTSPRGPMAGTERCLGSAGWADAGVSLPWEDYVSYADRRLLAEHYSAAKRWVDYVAAHNPDGIWSQARGVNDWGDWLSAGPATPKELGATAFFAHSADLLARMARALGKPRDAAKYQAVFEHIKQAFNRKYVAADGTIAGAPGSVDGERAQGNYALALQFGLLDENVKSAAMTHLLHAIQLADGHPTIGFWSTAGLLLALSENGQNAVAARMLALQTSPSWGYMADHGTTFWEAFDADQRNLSLNHWTHSSVGEWLWRAVAGLNPDPAHPGYEQFSVRPQPSAEVSWCRARYDSVRGPINISWRQAQTNFTLDLTVPVASTARVYLPAASLARVRESGRPVAETTGVKWLRQEDKTAVLQVESGSYHFKVSL